MRAKYSIFELQKFVAKSESFFPPKTDGNIEFFQGLANLWSNWQTIFDTNHDAQANLNLKVFEVKSFDFKSYLFLPLNKIIGFEKTKLGFDKKKIEPWMQYEKHEWTEAKRQRINFIFTVKHKKSNQ